MTIDEKKAFNIFCDESSHLPQDKMPYMLIGYVQVGSNDIRHCKDELRKIKSRPDYSHNDFYFRMYYQLLHHKMNLSYDYNVYCDIKDTRSHKKLARLKEMLHWNASIKNFQFMRSHESSFMQLTDLIIGAINYALRGRGVVAAKNRLIDIMEERCNGPITKSTPKSETKFNLFFIDLK